LDKLSHANAIGILFSGPSGTGKTLAVEVIANELKRNLYKIDLFKNSQQVHWRNREKLGSNSAEQKRAIQFCYSIRQTPYLVKEIT
jgi:SpoVK/Ycf46/Vps4 family AAA+-type ATPase